MSIAGEGISDSVAAPASHGPRRLLVIDKSIGNPDRLQEQLGPLPAQWLPTVVPSLTDGVRSLLAKSFDAVLLDAGHSEVTLRTGLDTIRAPAGNTPIIAWTSAPQLLNQHSNLDSRLYLVDRRQLGWSLLDQLVSTARRLLVLEEKLDGSERQLKMLAGQIPAMLWTTDDELRFTSMRGRELNELGLQSEAILGTTVESLFGTSRAGKLAKEAHRRALQGEPSSLELQWRHRWYHTHVEPLRSAQGEIAGTIGVALDVTEEQRLRRDVHAAHQIQEHLLPSQAPQLEGFDIAGRCYPAEDCSGDFFDFIPLPARRLAIVLADVSGHGFGPAILAAAIRSYLRMAAVLGNQVHEMLALANRLLLSDGELTPFASAFAASLDPESHSLRYASAGHPAYLIHFDGRLTRLESLAVPIGVRNDQMFTLSTRIKLSPGDVFLLASDGLFEAGAATGEQFGVQRAIEVVRENVHEDSKDLVEKLHSAAVRYTHHATLDDDQTIVVVRYVPRSGSLRETWTA